MRAERGNGGTAIAPTSRHTVVSKRLRSTTTGAAGGLDRALAAPRPARDADPGAQVHECLVELPRYGRSARQDTLGNIPHGADRHRSSAATDSTPAVQAERSGKDTSHVGVHGRCALLIRERCHGTRSVSPYTRERLQHRGIVRDRAVVFAHDDLGETVQVRGTPVVAKPLPDFANLVRTCGSEVVDRWEALEKTPVVLSNPGDLGLLQHELGDHDAVRVARGAPRQVSADPAKPAEQATLEGERVLRQSLGHGQGRYDGSSVGWADVATYDVRRAVCYVRGRRTENRRRDGRAL